VNIGIAVFSGTGNTMHVAGVLAERLRNHGAEVELFHIDADCRDQIATRLSTTAYDLIGIGHPVLGFGATPLMLRFVEALPEGRGKVFIFKSAGDNHRINNSASEKLMRVLQGKGYEIVHDFLYVMPCNWLIGYRRPFNLQIIDTVAAKAERHARELTVGVRSFLPVHRGWRLLARFFHFLESRYGTRQFGRSLRAGTGCTGCGLCVASCPVSNINEDHRGPRFGSECIWCMRCVYTCPAGAIEAPGMNWCILKGGYRLTDYIGATDRERTFITRESGGYWKHFVEYFFEKKNGSPS
jgi:ferredoxin/flavodoxin